MSASEAQVDEIMEDEEFEVPAEETPVETAQVLPLEDHTQQKRVIEALLFASPEPVSLRSMQARLPQTADVGRILTELQEKYAEGGVNLVQLEDVWAFRTASDVGPHLSLTKKEEKRLSRAALETMAIIAYHQPVTRAEVENIRGVATNKGTLDVLMESGWIKPGRRRETPGRPVTWTTTNQFLDDFGVSNLNDLPGLQELKASGLLDTRPAIDTIPTDLFNSANENETEEKENLGEFDQEDDADENDQGVETQVEENDENAITAEKNSSEDDSDDNAQESEDETDDEDSDEVGEEDNDDEDDSDDDEDYDDEDEEDEDEDDEEDED